MMHARKAGWLAGCLAVLAAGPVAAAPIPALSQGVVLDSAGARVYVAAAGGGVQARALSDGGQSWHSGQALEPVALIDPEHLLALASPPGRGSLQLVRMATTDGAVQSSWQIALPATVLATVVAQPQRRFTLTAAQESPAGKIRLAWEFRERALQGAWLATGKGETVGADDVQEQGVFDLDPGDGSATAVSDEFRRFDPLVPDGLRVGGLNDQRQFRSADSAHVEASAPIDHPQLGTVWEWQVHALAGRSRVLTLRLPVAYAPFQVAAERLFVQLPPMAWRISEAGFEVHERRLLAYSLADGQEAWSVDLADPEFRGVMPP